MSDIVRLDGVERLIHTIRGQKVMIDIDLAILYGAETRQLKRAVRRNIGRFPADFMFELTFEEYSALRCQIGTLEKGAHAKYRPFAFTEQGVAMLSGVLNSPKAVEVNIAIMRAFVRMREVLSTTKELAAKFKELENVVTGHDENIRQLFDAIHQLMTPPDPPNRKIGFHARRQS